MEIGKDKAKPIPEEYYNRYKLRLKERSGDYEERNITLFVLDIATGYRLQDLVDLTINDIADSIMNRCFDIQEKKQFNAWLAHMKKNPNSTKKPPDKRKHDIVPQLEKLLKNYIKGKKKSEYAFPSQKGQGSRHITAKAYSDILKRTAEDHEIMLSHITGHSLRKTYARRLYEAKKDLEYVRIALGHKDIETTKVYLGLEDDVREDAAKIAASKL